MKRKKYIRMSWKPAGTMHSWTDTISFWPDKLVRWPPAVYLIISANGQGAEVNHRSLHPASSTEGAVAAFTIFSSSFRCPNTAKVRHLAGILQQFISVLRRPIISMIMSPLKSIFIDLRICLKRMENMSILPTFFASAMNGA